MDGGGGWFHRLPVPENYQLAMSGLRIDHVYPPDAEGGVRHRRGSEPDGSVGVADAGRFSYPLGVQGGQVL